MDKQPSRHLFRTPVILLPGLLTLLFIALLAMAQHVAAATDVPEAPTSPPITKYYRIAAASSLFISTANDSASGSGPECTLRDALDIVNAGTTAGSVNGCVITTVGTPTSAMYVINLPTGGYTYTLNGSEMQINANTVYIVGVDENKTAIQANTAPGTATNRVLNVGSSAIVEIDHVAIRNGNTPSESGGGIFNSGYLSLANCFLTNNHAQDGGGISNNGGILAVENTSFSNNRALNGPGGGINNNADGLGVQSSLTVTGGTFTSNQALGGGSGGGIQSTGGNGGVVIANVDSVVFGGAGIGNATTGSGGGIGSYGYSGGKAILTVNHSAFISNTSQSGGGVWTGIWIGFGGTAVLTVSDTTFTGNSATAWGGGGMSNDGSTSIVENSTFTGNKAFQGDGGGFRNGAGTLTIRSSAFYSNTTLAICTPGNCSGGQGGGGANYATLTITNTRFAFNSATATNDGNGTWGGGHGGAIENGGILTIDKSQFNNNTAVEVPEGGGNGGAIDTVNWQPDGLSILLVRDTVFTGNRALGMIGGAINNISGNGGVSTQS